MFSKSLMRTVAAAVVIGGALGSWSPAQGAIYTQDFSGTPTWGEYWNSADYPGASATTTFRGHAQVQSGAAILGGNANTAGQIHIANINGTDAVQSLSVSFSEAVADNSQNSLVFAFGDIKNASYGTNGVSSPYPQFNTNHIVYLDLNFSSNTVVVKADGVTKGSVSKDTHTAGVFKTVTFSLDATGQVSVSFDGAAVFTNLATGFIPVAGDHYYFGAGSYGNGVATKYLDDISIVTAVPEPASLALLGLGGLCMLGGRSKRRA